MKQRFLILTLFLLGSYSVFSQTYLTGIGTKWSDEFTEWNVFPEDEEITGELTMRWQFQNDWTAWDYRIGEEIGAINQVWKNNPNQWELRGNNQVITARTVYSRDFREWRITDNDISVTLRSRWTNTFDEWSIKESDRYGEFKIMTSWEGDPREWVIIDEFDESISLPMKMCIVFLAVYHSVPRG